MHESSVVVGVRESWVPFASSFFLFLSFTRSFHSLVMKGKRRKKEGKETNEPLTSRCVRWMICCVVLFLSFLLLISCLHSTFVLFHYKWAKRNAKKRTTNQQLHLHFLESYIMSLWFLLVLCFKLNKRQWTKRSVLLFQFKPKDNKKHPVHSVPFSFPFHLI